MTIRSDRTLNRLSVAASFGLVLMVGATTGYIAWPKVAHAFGMKSLSRRRCPAYVAGQQIDVPAAWYNAAPKTLMLFARASCGACQKAQPFLKELVASLNGRASVLMAHPPGADIEDAAFAKSLGIGGRERAHRHAGLRVHATPTLVLVNSRARFSPPGKAPGRPTAPEVRP